MARRYSAVGSGAVAASPGRTLLTVIGAATIRPILYFAQMGFDTPADNQVECFLGRITTTGTVTAVTPQPLDNVEIASVSTSGKNASAEPTYSPAQGHFDFYLNQRSPYIWQTIPEYGVKGVATAANGFGLRAIHASATPGTLPIIHFEE